MNDQFLHRLRRRPPRGFAVRLKASLDRQPSGLRFRPRSSFARGLSVGLLLGGAALAVATVSMRGIPSQLLDRFWARESAAERDTNVSRSTTTALRPGDLDTERATGVRAPPPSRSSASNSSSAATNGAANSTVQALEPTVPIVTGGSPVAAARSGSSRDYVWIVGSSAEYPYTREALRRFGRSYKEPRIDATNDALNLYCGGTGAQHPDVLTVFRRIEPSEFQTCAENGVAEIEEVKIGHESIVLARSRLYGALDLSARDVFRALAKEIPHPDDPQRLIANRHTSWNEVNPALGYDRIEVLGPSLDSLIGNGFLALVIERGCKSYPWIAALEDDDPEEYARICRTVRGDGAYLEMSQVADSLLKLETYPSMIGVLPFNLFERHKRDNVVGNRLAGVEPAPETVAAGTYPAARTLYAYVKNAQQSSVPGIRAFLEAYPAPPDLFAVFHREVAEWRLPRGTVIELTDRPSR